MAATNDDVARLVVNLDATTTKFTNAMKRALAETNKTAKGVEDRFDKMSRTSTASFDRLGNSMRTSLSRPIAALTGALGTREIIKYADTWTEAGNRIAAAGAMVGLQGRSLEDIRKLADESRSAFDPTVQLYSRILRSAGGVAQSELEIAKATDVVNKAFKAGGAASSEMAAGILQLSQGLSSGVLQGDELRSVRENAPVLAQAIADYFGVTIGGLKDLGSEGKLTSEAVFKAIVAGQGKIEAAFNKTNRTIGEGFTAVQNALIEYIGLSDKSMGVTGMLNQALLALADNFENVADISLKLASIIAGALIGKSLLKMVTSLGLGAKAVKDLVFGMNALRAGATASGTAITALSAAATPLAAIFGAGIFLGMQAVVAEAGRVSVALSEISTTANSLGYASDENTEKLNETIKKVNELTEAEAKLLGQRATADRNLVLRGTPLSNFASMFTGGELSTVLQASDRFVGVLVDTMASKADREAATVANDLAIALIKGLELNLADVNKTLSDLINMDGVSEDMKNSIREFFEVLKILDQANFIATIHVDTSELDTALSNVESSFESLTTTAAFFDLPESIQRSILDLTENFDGSLESVEALDIAINELAGTNSIFLYMANALNPFIDKVYAAFDAVKALNAASREARALASAGVADPIRASEDFANDPNKMFENTAKFVTEQRRINSLTSEQLDLEKEIARIRKDQPNLALSESALTQLARDNLAAAQGRRDSAKSAKSDSGGSKDADKFAEFIANTEKEIELLGKEAAMLATLNPLAAGYTLELEKWRKEQELLTAAEEAGILLTPDLRAKISLLAQGYAEASEAVEQLKQANDDARESMEAWFDLAKSSTRSFIDDLIEGKSAADALANALNQVGSYLINLGLDSLFGGSGGGLFGGFFGLPGREKGGPVSAGQPYIVGEKRAELFVPTQNGVIIPKVPSSISSNSSGSGGFVFSPVIDARGASPEAVARLEDVVRRQNADFEIMVKKIVMDRGRGKW